MDLLRLLVRGLWSSRSLPLVSNHTYRRTQRLSQYLPFPSPQVSISDALFLGAQGGDQSPLPPNGVGSCLWTGHGALPYPEYVPGELVHPSYASSWGPASGSPVQKRTQNTVRWCASFVSGLLPSNAAEPPVWRLKGLAWLESRWGLQKCCRN